MRQDHILAKGGDLSIPKYVEKVASASDGKGAQALPVAWASFESDGRDFWAEMDSLLDMLDGIAAAEANDA